MSVTELAEKVGITMANLSILKNGKAKAIRLSTLDAICSAAIELVGSGAVRLNEAEALGAVKHVVAPHA
jgi:hypothetical protein